MSIKIYNYQTGKTRLYNDNQISDEYTHCIPLHRAIMRWFAYNGDADGICSMVQWGLVHGIEGKRITGVKRDIELLKKVSAKEGDELVVMDISLARNASLASDFERNGVKIQWFDHHLAGSYKGNIDTYIDNSPSVCTAIIVQEYLGIKSNWSQVALHGDGLSGVSNMPSLKELGELLNYNGYGKDISDLHFHPDNLLLSCMQAKTPEMFLETKEFEILKKGFAKDIEKSESISLRDGAYILPNEAWARRVVGVFAHRINSKGSGPHVIAIEKEGSYQISLRGQSGIGELCAMFGGGGRETAGGIDDLPKEDMAALMNEVDTRRDK